MRSIERVALVCLTSREHSLVLTKMTKKEVTIDLRPDEKNNKKKARCSLLLKLPLIRRSFSRQSSNSQQLQRSTSVSLILHPQCFNVKSVEIKGRVWLEDKTHTQLTRSE